jgi:putative membrane protein
MYVRRTIDPSVIWFFSKVPLLLFALWSGVAFFLYSCLNLTSIALPFLPVATIGTAVAFYVGFKNNASYERLWEARKIWAEIEHLTRLLTDIVLTLPDNASISKAEKAQILYRQIAWLNALRLTLRQTHPFHSETIGNTDQALLVDKKTGINDTQSDIYKELSSWIPHTEIELLRRQPNIPSTLLRLQMQSLREFEHSGLQEHHAGRIFDVIKELGEQQSAAERINNFPFPRQYAHFSSLFVNIFIVLLPFSLLSELKSDPRNLWLVVPFSVLISWVFFTMEKVGDSSENPFENGINDVPLSAICRNLEIEIRLALGEEEVPEPLTPKDHILM